MARLPPWPAGPVKGERPDRPFTGYKLAHAVLSADGAKTTFAGLTLGATLVYGAVADACCVWNRRHAPPRRWCGCGFYCLHDLADARSLACATENRAALLLEVTASGRYLRYERGLRYSKQRVRAILDAQCACGRPGTALADAGSGLIGWRHLAPACGACAAGRPVLTLRDFTARLDGPVRIASMPPSPVLAAAAPDRPVSGDTVPGDTVPEDTAPRDAAPAGLVPADPAPRARAPRDPVPGAGESPIAVLAAEIALLHARLDDLQSRLDK